MASLLDPALAHLRRAPVDEFFAGRNSAVIDDEEWDKSVSQAERILGRERGGKNFKEGLGNALAGYMVTGSIPINLRKNGNLDSGEGSDHDKDIRSGVHEKTGLFMYPGQGIKTDPEDVTFMREFDDSGATLAEGWRDGESLPETLGGLLQHEELYKHYPELANMPIVNETDPQLLGWYGDVSEDNPIGMMGVQAQKPDDEVLKTLIHESQHYIQDLEGWPAGASYGSRTANDSFAAGQPERFGAWDKIWQGTPAGSEAEAQVEAGWDWEGYANSSGEILSRDVEARLDKRNELAEKMDSLLNPEHPDYYPDRTDDNRDRLLGRLRDQSDEIDKTYPYTARTDSNSYPHDIIETEELMPLLMTAAMANRKGDKYAESSRDYAEGLLEQIMQKRVGR